MSLFFLKIYTSENFIHRFNYNNIFRRSISLLFLAVFFFTLKISYAQNDIFNQSLTFESITSENGLLQSDIICSMQSTDDYLWFGSNGGLQRFDGSDFTNYKHNDTLNGSISSNKITALYQDKKNRIWIGTDKGLNLYVPSLNKFKLFSSGEYGFKNFELKKIIEDQSGMLWIATYGGGIAVFNPDQEKIIKWYNRATNSINGNLINTVFIDSHEDVWIGAESVGLKRLNKSLNRFEYYPPFNLGEQTVNCIKEDEDGYLWVGTWANGLYKYGLINKKNIHYSFNSKNEFSIPGQTIRDLCFDAFDHIWLVSTNGIGLFGYFSSKHAAYIGLSMPSLSLQNVPQRWSDRRGCFGLI
jgi:ligand-binding sensor domain-containing protein